MFKIMLQAILTETKPVTSRLQGKVKSDLFFVYKSMVTVQMQSDLFKTSLAMIPCGQTKLSLLTMQPKNKQYMDIHEAFI